MKKIISLTLALLLVFSFTACSNSQAKDTQSSTTQVDQTTQQETSETTTESTTKNDEKKIKMDVDLLESFFIAFSEAIEKLNTKKIAQNSGRRIKCPSAYSISPCGALLSMCFCLCGSRPA